MKVDLRIGRSERVTDLLRAEVHCFPEVSAPHMYGAGARGEYESQSDIDIVIHAPGVTP